MNVVGQVESVWRYPVKSMRGESMPEIFAGFAGVYGDRLFAFRSSAAPAGFPYFTGREYHELLLYKPRFRHPHRAALPQNLADAQALAPGLNLNPVGADPADLVLDVETPSGKVLAIDDPALLRELVDGAKGDHALTLLRANRSMTDCRPISLIALQTARQLSEEVGAALDQRRFRANVYLDLLEPTGFAENGLVGRKVRIGATVTIAILERDPRCQMITLDPDTGAPNPAILRRVAQAHDGMAGVYAAVLVEGTIRSGDPVEVLD
jgi:MOSC domain-containing protein